MRKIILIVWMNFLLLLFLGSQGVSVSQLEGCAEHIKYGAPSHNPVVLCRLGYILSHNSNNKVPEWVAYHLTKAKMLGNHPRTEDFRPDPDLEEGERAELKDYKKSGYDRGHMAPAGSMRWSERAMSESFLLSNIAPQVGIGFNRHIWKKLESNVRKWTRERAELYIVTGPIYEGTEIDHIGKNKIAIPTHFFKVIFDPIQVDAIAFILPNKKLKSVDLPKYIKSVDDVEAKTSLDFLPELEDSVEDLIEAKTQLDIWQ